MTESSVYLVSVQGVEQHLPNTITPSGHIYWPIIIIIIIIRRRCRENGSATNACEVQFVNHKISKF